VSCRANNGTGRLITPARVRIMVLMIAPQPKSFLCNPVLSQPPATAQELGKSAGLPCCQPKFSLPRLDRYARGLNDSLSLALVPSQVMWPRNMMQLTVQVPALGFLQRSSGKEESSCFLFLLIIVDHQMLAPGIDVRGLQPLKGSVGHALLFLDSFFYTVCSRGCHIRPATICLSTSTVQL